MTVAIEIGDCVRRWGSRDRMTVERCGDDHVHCIWFTEIAPGQWAGPERARVEIDEIARVIPWRTP